MVKVQEENIQNICIILILCILFLPYILHQKMLQRIYDSDLNIVILILICAGLLFIDYRIGILFFILFLILGLKSRFNNLSNLINEIKYSKKNDRTNELDDLDEDKIEEEDIKETFFRDSVPVNQNQKIDEVESFVGIKKVRKLNEELVLNDEHQTGLSNKNYFGPPLSKCSEYNLKNYNKVGTYFYPMN